MWKATTPYLTTENTYLFFLRQKKISLHSYFSYINGKILSGKCRIMLSPIRKVLKKFHPEGISWPGTALYNAYVFSQVL